MQLFPFLQAPVLWPDAIQGSAVCPGQTRGWCQELFARGCCACAGKKWPCCRLWVEGDLSPRKGRLFPGSHCVEFRAGSRGAVPTCNPSRVRYSEVYRRAPSRARHVPVPAAEPGLAVRGGGGRGDGAAGLSSALGPGRTFVLGPIPIVSGHPCSHLKCLGDPAVWSGGRYSWGTTW